MPENRQRHLVVIRHAKSDWGTGEPDIDRPLSSRGRRDAPAVGRWLARQPLSVEAAIVSPSARTRATWDLLADAAGLAVDPMVDGAVYLAETADLAEAVGTLDAAVRCAALVGHAPGCPDFVEWVTGGRGDPDAVAAMRSKFPTAAAAWVVLDAPWDGLRAGCGALARFAVCRG